MADRATFDVVVVGAGPAGCVLASRLTEDPGRRVALLEAGPDYGPDPAAWPADLRDPRQLWLESHPWGYHHAGRAPDRPLPLPRARIVGGSSTVNGCFWLRGSAADYDEWDAAGNPGWSFADLLPYFRRSESDPLGGPLHGTDGPVPVFRAADADLTPIDRAFDAAAEALGFPRVADFNGTPEQRPGVGPMPKNLAGGVRMNAAFTYLAPARTRPNLDIVADALVDRVLLDGHRATGVLLADGREIRGREIVLCAGAFGSPAILLRSGLGPADHLRALGIPVVADRPGVGECLLDHPLIDDVCNSRVLAAHVPPEQTFCPTLLMVRTPQAPAEIDLHVYHGQHLDEPHGGWVLWFSISLEHGTSRGSVRLTAPDPEATLEIDHRHLSEPREIEAFCDGVELVGRLVATPPLAPMLEPLPGWAVGWRDRDDLRERVREHVATTFHPSSTCRMGPQGDAAAVVDRVGRVHGFAGLRVADAAIFPTGPRANLHCTVVAVAEKLAAAMRDGGDA